MSPESNTLTSCVRLAVSVDDPALMSDETWLREASRPGGNVAPKDGFDAASGMLAVVPIDSPKNAEKALQFCGWSRSEAKHDASLLWRTRKSK